MNCYLIFQLYYPSATSFGKKKYVFCDTPIIWEGPRDHIPGIYIISTAVLAMRAQLASTAAVLAMRAQLPEAFWPLADPRRAATAPRQEMQ